MLMRMNRCPKKHIVAQNKMEQLDKMSFISALGSTQLKCESPLYVDLEDWHRMHRLLRRPCDEPPNTNVAFGESFDFMDSSFIAFHSELRDVFLYSHGLLADSHAAKLYQTVAPCLHVVEEEDVGDTHLFHAGDRMASGL